MPSYLKVAASISSLILFNICGGPHSLILLNGDSLPFDNRSGMPAPFQRGWVWSRPPRSAWAQIRRAGE